MNHFGHNRPMFPLWVRIWHWVNAILFVILAITGYSLHFAGSEVVPVSFQWAVKGHNTAGALLLLNYLIYIFNLLRTGDWRQYVPRLRGLPSSIAEQVRYYTNGIFRGEEHPHHATPEERFNPLQRLTYLGVMFAAFPILAVTGVFLLFPGSAPSQIAGMGGVWPMAVAHTLMSYVFVAFTITHIYLGLTCSEPHSGLGAMVTGGVIKG